MRFAFAALLVLLVLLGGCHRDGWLVGIREDGGPWKQVTDECDVVLEPPTDVAWEMAMVHAEAVEDGFDYHISVIRAGPGDAHPIYFPCLFNGYRETVDVRGATAGMVATGERQERILPEEMNVLEGGRALLAESTAPDRRLVIQHAGSARGALDFNAGIPLERREVTLVNAEPVQLTATIRTTLGMTVLETPTSPLVAWVIPPARAGEVDGRELRIRGADNRTLAVVDLMDVATTGPLVVTLSSLDVRMFIDRGALVHQVRIEPPLAVAATDISSTVLLEEESDELGGSILSRMEVVTRRGWPGKAGTVSPVDQIPGWSGDWPADLDAYASAEVCQHGAVSACVRGPSF